MVFQQQQEKKSRRLHICLANGGFSISFVLNLNAFCLSENVVFFCFEPCFEHKTLENEIKKKKKKKRWL
jgi:hypothetical protein